MKSRIYCLLLLLFFAHSLSYAQGNSQSQAVSKEDVQSYLNQVTDYAVIYSGKVEEPYSLNPTNHPYFYTDEFSVGTLSYNNITYPDVMLRFDMYRRNILVKHSQIPYGIELNREKVDWAILNGYKIIESNKVDWENVPDNRFLILLHDGIYPIAKTSTLFLEDRIYNSAAEYYFSFKDYYYICVNDVCYHLKNKRSLLNLFPDKKRELDQYAKQMKLNFRKDPKMAYVELIKHYEKLSR
jgi:hypothetical protein